jgi:hypothetical protein
MMPSVPPPPQLERTILKFAFITAALGVEGVWLGFLLWLALSLLFGNIAVASLAWFLVDLFLGMVSRG